MGVLYDYFHAADRTTAVDWAIGPGGDWLAERPSLDEVGADWVDMKGLDPHVVLGQLVAFTEGRPYDVRAAGPELVWPDLQAWPYERRAAPGEESPWDSGLHLVELPDAWRDRLAAIEGEHVPMLALQWYDIEEVDFADFHACEDHVRAFAGLARRARAAGTRLYCFCCP
ncbi:hypothetical protein AQI95_18190 [Streptomyces yokosukanensis]|uniref:DUF1877 domain-containing protein n=1 Tax=Streptomyces yokosukanensis TaxID=67386 RepID=A0A101P4M1_9ACTN|nr:hypothetical protein [Streptomyces yokosukanensis]KUN04819.1 hypothetical protein AQI95_18190 [Streptomyces yokosukanensis]